MGAERREKREREKERERAKETSARGWVRPHKGSGALLIRKLIGMPRMPTIEQGFGSGILKSRCKQE